jgi:hypothetical protein
MSKVTESSQREVDDIISYIPLLGDLFGQLTDGDDKARQAIEDPGSESGEKFKKERLGASAPGMFAVAKANANRKAAKGVLDAPVGKAKKIRAIGMDDILTTGTEIPPQAAKSASKAAPKASKAAGVFKEIAENAGHTGKIVGEEAAERAVTAGGERVFKEAGEEAAKKTSKSGAMFKTVGKGALKLAKKHPIMSILALGFGGNQLFGGKKERPIDPKDKFTIPNKSSGKQTEDDEARLIRERFNQFREQLKTDLENLEK